MRTSKKVLFYTVALWMLPAASLAQLSGDSTDSLLGLEQGGDTSVEKYAVPGDQPTDTDMGWNNGTPMFPTTIRESDGGAMAPDGMPQGDMPKDMLQGGMPIDGTMPGDMPDMGDMNDISGWEMPMGAMGAMPGVDNGVMPEHGGKPGDMPFAGMPDDGMPSDMMNGEMMGGIPKDMMDTAAMGGIPHDIQNIQVEMPDMKPPVDGITVQMPDMVPLSPPPGM